MFFGKVLGIQNLILYDGNNIKELVEDFHNAVDDYLALCVAERILPECDERPGDSIDEQFT